MKVDYFTRVAFQKTYATMTSKGNRSILAAWPTGDQMLLQLLFAGSDRKINEPYRVDVGMGAQHRRSERSPVEDSVVLWSN